VLSAVQLNERLRLVGTLTDTEFNEPISTVIEAEFSPALIQGAHIPREATWVLDADGHELGFSWRVESVERPSGYAIQDAHVESALGQLRAFAIEDLATVVGVGLGVGIAGALIWLNENRLEKARKEARELWQECLAKGRKPSWAFGVTGAVSFDETGFPLFEARSSYQVKCD
jgi:hypothetical protein